MYCVDVVARTVLIEIAIMQNDLMAHWQARE